MEVETRRVSSPRYIEFSHVRLVWNVSYELNKSKRNSQITHLDVQELFLMDLGTTLTGILLGNSQSKINSHSHRRGTKGKTKVITLGHKGADQDDQVTR